MSKSAGEKAILKEEKRLEKKRKQSIEQANKMLIPVGKKTAQSLGIISFDPEGVFRLLNNRWIKIYTVSGNLGSLAKLCDSLKGRIRFTMHLGAEGGRATCHLTLMETGEIYEEIRQMIKEDEAILSSSCSLKKMSVDEVMNEIMNNNFKENRFSYASYVRGKRDWYKECFTEVIPDTDHFKQQDYYGEAFFVLAFVGDKTNVLLEKLGKLGCPVIVGIDLNSLTKEEWQDFKRAIEKSYNIKSHKESEDVFLNASMEFFILCDSDDARVIVEQTVTALGKSSGVTIAPCFFEQKKYVHSIESLGLMEATMMRNVKASIMQDLIGGGEHADAKIEI